MNSDEYWKLYENYTGALKKIAEIQDTLETTKKDLADAQTQSKSKQHKPPHKSIANINQSLSLLN
jgi:hypothetical protein